MYEQMRSLRRVSMSAGVRTVACLVAAWLLAACSPGSRVSLGSGQVPDQATVDFPIFYVKHTVPTASDDLRLMRPPVPQADLFERATASPSAAEINITAR